MLEKLSPEQIKAHKEAGTLETIIEAEKEIGLKNDVSSGLPYINPAYTQRPGTTNQYGIFTQPGVRPQTWDATVQPMDITSLLSPNASPYLQERVGILTGQTDMSGTNPETVCDTPPVVGQLKTCQQNYTFGTAFMSSEKLSLASAGQLANRAVVPEREIMNRAPSDPFVPELLTQPGLNLMSMQSQAFYQLGTALRRAIARVMITGNPATAASSTVKGFIKEFNGLDTLIKTGYVDAITGNACPAADSVVVSWNALTSATVGGLTLGQLLTNVYTGRQILAQQLGITANWAWVMPMPLFQTLTFDFAAEYFINRLTTPASASNPLVVDSARARDLQLQMAAGQYLLMNNVQVPVVFSDGIPVSSAGNNAVSDIYLVPVSVNGVPGIHFDFFPLNNQFASELAAHFDSQVVYMNGGMYATVWERTLMCVQAVIMAQFRMYLEAPFLAGRVDDVQFSWQTGLDYRSPYAGASYYNGGNTYYTDING